MALATGIADHCYDVAVIGAGVVGCAIARRLTLDGHSVVILEKAPDVLDGASKANSGILHTGFDAPEGSLELACIREGYDEYMAIHERLGLPLIRTGALVLAWNEEEERALAGLVHQAEANGINDIELLDAAAARRLEPALSPAVRAGFRVPGEFVIDPWSAPHGYLRQAVENGAQLLCSAEVLAAAFDGQAWHLDTARGPVRARLAVNAAGLFADRIDQLLLGASAFQIRPRKGQFIVYDKPAASLAGHILLPVPSRTTKGVVVCRTAFGNLLVGPTAEEQDDRVNAMLDSEALDRLRRRGEEILPALAGQSVTAVYAGLRPATEEKGYRFAVDADRRAITVGGIRSTGLSAALGLARLVARSLEDLDSPARPLRDAVWPVMPALSDETRRDWTRAGNGGIVCHCELVTEREIEAALAGPIPAASLAGLKRRTRVTMGRCQGFYCSARLARMTAGRLVEPIAGGFDGNG